LPAEPVKTTIDCVSGGGGRNHRDLSSAVRNSTTLQTRRSFSHPALAGWRRREEVMKNPLDSLWGTIICGVVLTAILYYVVKSILT
jgi:hypothetical protein